MDKELERILSRLPAKIRRLYEEYYRKVLADPRIRRMVESGKMDERTIARVCDGLEKDFAAKLEKVLSSSVTDATGAGKKNAALTVSGGYTGVYAEAAENAVRTAEKALRGIAAMASGFMKTRDVSERVWRYTEQTRKDMAVMLDNGITEGKSAADISRRLKQYLNEPDRLFRRVRDKETGELRLSKAAREYHPGRGVYRSSHQNAMRLARTEVNAAYRDAEQNAYAGNPLVKGYEIRLSNNHTTKLPNGKTVPLEDICDDLQGIYSKWFRWSGWHPNCRCRMLPITLTNEEMAEYIKAKREGKVAEFSAKHDIRDLPDNFKAWVGDNGDRIAASAGRGTLPYFLRDNGTMEDGQWVANS